MSDKVERDASGAAIRQRKETRCTATQINRRAPDFECRLMTAHTVHVDPRTGLRWGDGQLPRGYARKWSRKKYGNPKLHRQSLLMGKARGR